MKDLKIIMLDFDGVLVESVGIKDEAFKELFKEYPECLSEILEYHLAHNAVIRFEKFQYIYEIILKKKYTEKAKNDLCQRFSDLVVQKIIACPAVEGSQEFLEYFFNKESMYLISINPDNELQQILQARGLNRYFKRVYAFPWKKVDAIKDILKKESVREDQAVFVGDTPEDRLAAEETKVPFLGRNSGKNIGGQKGSFYQNLFEIKKALGFN